MTAPGFHALRRALEAEEWKNEALCNGRGDVFFPERNSENRFHTLTSAECVAKSICARCPVRRECLQAGLREEYGIWGGTTPRDRANARKRKATVEQILDAMDEQAVRHGLAPRKATNGGKIR